MQRLALVAVVFVAWMLASKPASAELRVVTTTTDLGYFASTIGGDRVHVDTICQGSQDPHFVQARPSYMVTLSRADLLVAVGLELEVGWLPSLIQGARNPAINPGRPGYFEASSAIRPIDVPEGGADRSRGDIHPFGNPHFWLDPLSAKLAAHALAERMAALDAKNAEFFRQNERAFEARIDKKLSQWTAQMAPFKNTKIASYHATFNYFHRRFGLTGIGYLEDRPGIPPSPAHLVDLIRQMKKEMVPVIFHESFYDHSTSDMVASRTGARVLVLPTSVGGAKGVTTYEQLIDKLVSQFAGALKEGSSMMEALVFLGPALALCLVIASIHVYLGMHVLAREVIFVDLSLAQLAALGATVAALMTSEEEPGWPAHSMALGFTIVGAAIFAFTRHARRHVSQEAIVGIVYAVASAVTVLVVSHSPHGAEHIKDILVGSLLNTTWTNVWQTALAYAVLGALELFFARRFISISWRPEEAEQGSRFVELWDFGFYVLFGLVITISVRFAGILLVFSFLIVPAVITGLFVDRLMKRLVLGWGVAIAASALGIWASWTWDFPTGAAIVAAFGALLLAAGMARIALRSRDYAFRLR